MRLRAGAVLVDKSVNLLDVEDQSLLLADVANLLPGVVLVLGLHVVSFRPILSRQQMRNANLEVEHRRLSGGIVFRALVVLVQLFISSQ